MAQRTASPSSEWGLPNWRNEAEYQRDLTLAQFAWEFCRRSPAYRAFWEAEIKPHIRPGGSFDYFQAEDLRNHFDLMGPLDPRKSYAKSWFVGASIRLIKGQSQSKRRPARLAVSGVKGRPDKYVTYLRTLDALASGASLDEIARVLHPELGNAYPDHRGRNRVKNDKRAAERLRDGDYRFIPMLSPSGRRRSK
jgi:hypothetical protein